MSFKELAHHVVDWIFFEKTTFIKSEHRTFFQNLFMKYSKRFYKELSIAVQHKILSFYYGTLQHKKEFSERENHQVFMLISLIPYCDFDQNAKIVLPIFRKDIGQWRLCRYCLKNLSLQKFIYNDPKRVVFLTPLTPQEAQMQWPYHLIFMGTHPLPTSPGWQVGLCADSNPFLNFGELILKVFKKEIFELVDLVTLVKKAPLLCSGHSLGAALSLLLYQEKHHELVQVYALNPPRFINKPKEIKLLNSQCSIYIQKGDLLEQVGLNWPSWTKVHTLSIDKKKYKVRPFMAHCRCFTALDECVIETTQGDPSSSKTAYALRYLLTSLWQIFSFPVFLFHNIWMFFKYLWPFKKP